MSDYPDSKIAALLDCQKKISEAPKRDMRLTGADFRNEMKMKADGVPGEFLVFIRQNQDFPENFSVGIVYQPGDGSGEIPLLRCNGPHGAFNGKGDPLHPHWGFHVHMATEESIESGSHPLSIATANASYASLREAIQFFLKRVNLDVSQAVKYFPDDTAQAMLF